MELSALLSLIVAWSWIASFASGQTKWPLHNDGLNSVVEWDHYSYLFNGQRLFVWSGEMHYWRAPVPEMWIDILEKFKAAGFTAISLYANWGYHSASNGSLDFKSGGRDFTQLFDIAKQVGLYAVFRPGPFIEAEVTAGGFPGWLTTGAYGSLRNTDARYTNAWTPYFTKISQLVAEHQVSKGGPVYVYQIENEYGHQFSNTAAKTPNNNAIAYMELLEASARSSGIDIPLTCNNPSLGTKSWSKDYSTLGGSVDIYGLDSYPSCWSCNLAECGNKPDFTVVDYYSNFQEVSPSQPSVLAEFQGGSYNPWGGPQGGCGDTTGPDWVNVFYRHNIAQKVASMNMYMVFGGTSWGGIGIPIVATSYDFSAPISESRVIGDKFYETKLIAQFIRVARDLTKVDLVNSGTQYASTSLISASELRNAATNGAFYVTIHASSPSTESTAFKLNVATSEGNMTIPKYASNIVLNGRQSKIICTDFPVGNQKLVYSTAEIFTVSVQDGIPIVFLWLPAGESGEFFLTGVQQGQAVKTDGTSNVRFVSANGGIITSYTQATGSSVFKFDNGYRIVVMDRSAAYYTWVPTTSTDPYTPENSTVVVQGPYLIRSVSVQNEILNLTGDWLNSTTLEVFAPSSVRSIILNNASLNVSKTAYGSLVGQLQASDHSISSIEASLPALTKWTVNDGLPERSASYDDSKWVAADHSTTTNPTKPETYPVLYADEYGFHSGALLWRGRFSGTKSTGIDLKVIGGDSSGWSAFVNGAYIGGWPGGKSTSTSEVTLSFANATLSTDNVILVIQDHMGKDATNTLNPRGIINASLMPSGTFTSWKVAGNAGGEANIDPIRGWYAEGGLHAERLGWHLPGFDDSSWAKGSPTTGLSQAGVNFYRTVVPLDLPNGMDVSLGFVLGAPAGSKLRAQLYVNGWMFGKFIPYIGNQIVFPVFPGILDYYGNNTICLNVWAQDAGGASVSIKWTVLGATQSSFSPSVGTAYLRPGWTDRSQYA